MKSYCICPPNIYEKVIKNELNEYSLNIFNRRDKLTIKIKKEIISQGELVILSIDNILSTKMELNILELKSNNISIIVLTNENNLDLALTCGALGVNKVINCNTTNSITEIAKEVILENKCKVTMKDLGITVTDYPANLRKALKIIEKKYTTLMGISEVAQVVKCSQSSLSQLFKKNNLTAPKKVLMYLKVGHALNLLKGNHEILKLKEISLRSGFSCEKRFIECFKRTLNQAPSDVRQEIDIQLFDKYLNKLHVQGEIFTAATA